MASAVRTLRRIKTPARPRARGESMLQPVLLSGAGRSGTTLMMQLLATAPSVVVDGRPPHEVHWLSYLYRWASSLDPLDSEKLEELVGPRPTPWSQSTLMRFEPFAEDRWRLALLDAWRELSVRLARHRWPDDPSRCLFYAEKEHDLPPGTIDRVVACRRIYLVRDPRDRLLSVLAFDRRRGFRGFGRGDDQTVQSYLDEYLRTAVDVLHQYEQARAGAAVFKARYEDLVADPSGEAERLGSWLGSPVDENLVRRHRPDLESHMTSPTPESSIGRWRRELPAPIRRLFARRLGPQLERLGYEA